MYYVEKINLNPLKIRSFQGTKTLTKNMCLTKVYLVLIIQLINTFNN